MHASLLLSLVLSIGTAFAIFDGFDISNATLQLPSNQTQLILPTNSTPSFVALAIGVQNYTCGVTSSWISTGAFAELFDISGLVSDPSFLALQIPAFQAWNATGAAVDVSAMIVMFGGAPSVLGQHYYISDDTTGSIEPKWDFSSAAFPGDQQAFFIGSKVGDIPSPDGNVSNIDWVSLANVDGALADTVFRVDTIGGQPPSLDCAAWDSSLSVKFAAKYWFFGGSFSTGSSAPPPNAFSGINATATNIPQGNFNSTDPDTFSTPLVSAASSTAPSAIPSPSDGASSGSSGSGYRSRLRRRARPLLTKF